MSTPSPESLAARGRLRWPGLALPEGEFARYVGLRCPAEVDPGSLAIEDLYLAFGCTRADAVALSLFEQVYMTVVEKTLLHREKDPLVVDETKQRVRARLLVAAPGDAPRISEYRGQGSLAAWLRVVAVRELIETHRAGHHAAALPDDDDLPAPTMALLSPEIAADQERLVPAVRLAFRTALGNLPPRDRTLLKLHYVDGLPLERIGALYQVNKGTVSRWLAAIRARLSDDVLDLVRRSTGVSPEETRSLLRLLQSQVELSLRALRDEAPG